jgi:outer membrane lipoprotein-sorting protein
MFRFIGLVAVAAGVGLAIAASVVSPTLDSFAKSINAAKALSVSYSYQSVEGVRSEYTVDLKKPNLARIDEPTRTVIADGSTITILDKTKNIYYKQPQTDEALTTVLGPDALHVWSGFFAPNAYQPTASRDLGSVSRGGSSFDAVEAQFGPNAANVTTYYIDPGDKIVRQAKLVEANGDQKATYILRTRSVMVNGSVPSDLFTFNPPQDSKEVSYAEMMAAKWYTNIAEAKKAAAARHPDERFSWTSLLPGAVPATCWRTRFWTPRSSRTSPHPS